MMVTLRAEPDPARPLGHARIVLQGLAQPPSDAAFCIRREGYPTANLGPRGWQVREERLTPAEVFQEGGNTVLVVGPTVTRHLEPAPFIFLLPGAKLEQPLFWPDTIDVFDGEPPPDTPAAPEPLAYRPPPVQQAPAQPPPVAAQPVEAPRLPVDMPAAPPPRGSRMPLLLGLGVLLLAAAGGVVWLLAGDRTETSPIVMPVPAPPSVAQQPATPPPVAAVPWLERTDGMALRELVESAPDAAGIHAAAQRRQASGRHDDALVLFEEAGDRGHAPALTALARLYDPNGFVAGRPFRNPDPRAAARYYQDAVEKGDAAAAEPRAALRATLEEQASAGNGTAETALREFWP